jgi:hypothetical protein
MHKRLSRSLSKGCINTEKGNSGPWDEAILEARNQIARVENEASQRIARLTESMQTFEALRDSGAEFPKVNGVGELKGATDPDRDR